MSSLAPGVLADRLVDATTRCSRGPFARRAYAGTLRGAGGERVLDRLLAMAGPVAGERVLVLGCHGGLIQRMLALGAAEVAGIDPAPDMVELTRLHNQTAAASGRLELHVGKAAQLPWPDESFTAVLSASLFFFFDQPPRVLGEIRRVLVPGGRLAIASTLAQPQAGSLRQWWVWAWGRRARIYTDQQLHTLLVALGFTGVRVGSSYDGQPPQLAFGRRR